MSGTFQIDGELFPKNPLRTTWAIPQVGVRGDGVPLFAGFGTVTCRMPILTTDEFKWFENKWASGTLHTVVLPARDDHTLTTYTGVAIRSALGNKGDVPGYVFNGVVVLAHVPS